MESRVEIIEAKKLVGISRQMSLANDDTMTLWKSFMPRRGEIRNRTSCDYISMQVYDPAAGDPFSPTTNFKKWAVVEVSSDETVPDGMKRYLLAGGQYAIFLHKGPASLWPQSMQYIYGTWLPESLFELDDREHFEILPEGYDPMDSEAEEEIFIPIRGSSG